MKSKYKKKKYNIHNVIQILVIVFFFIIWQSLCSYNETVDVGVFINPKWLPSPSEIIKLMYGLILDGTLIIHFKASLIRMFWGFIWALVIAIVLGVLVSSFKVADDIVSPLLSLIQPIPAFAFLPMFIIWFGVGEKSKIIMIAYMAFGPLFTYFVEGLRNTNPLFIRSAKCLGANPIQVFTNITFKAALPNLFVGIRLGIGSTFSAMVVAELMGANEGLGYIINYSRNYFMICQMFVAAISIGLTNTIFIAIISIIEKILFRWKRNGIDSAIEK